MKVYRDIANPDGSYSHTEEIINIMEGTYTGKDMGERSITANIKFAAPIDFKIGDYVEFDVADLVRQTNVEGGHNIERFYIYTMPVVKKTARSMSVGDAFEHTVTFYPRQYELGTVLMKDLMPEVNANNILYTGGVNVAFVGGAHELMRRIIANLRDRFGTDGVAGKDYWDYKIADAVNEDRNTSLESFQFEFSSQTVMDAIMELNNKDKVNTKFWINERMIYVGFKRPYVCGVDDMNVLRTVPFDFEYGKTSHLPINVNHGNLFSLTKSVGSASPITRLYASGGSRNLHRFYCADRIKAGRYVDALQLPSFENDGKTDYIDSQESIAKFGIREGAHKNEDIYPSLRYFTYGDLRQIKYCIKMLGTGDDENKVYEPYITILRSEITDVTFVMKPSTEGSVIKEHESIWDAVIVTFGGKKYELTGEQYNELMSSDTGISVPAAKDEYAYPIARIQCYKVVENPDNPMHNILVESAPPVDLAVFCHATGKVIKCVLYADPSEQAAHDVNVPERNGVQIPGACYAIHDDGFGCGHQHGTYTRTDDYHGKADPYGSPLSRADWFINSDKIDVNSTLEDEAERDAEIKAKRQYKNEIEIHQMTYSDTHWITDIYDFVSYDQETFNRQGYSAYCYPRITKKYYESESDAIDLSAVVAVGPVVTEDTDLGENNQPTFDVFIRDCGFALNERTWFGEKVFLYDTVKLHFLEGLLAGLDFEIADTSESGNNEYAEVVVPAINPDGSDNPAFYNGIDRYVCQQAKMAGAFWRLRVKRQESQAVNRYYLPNKYINASAGDKFVFLDIYMPDVYIRVAEQRLLREEKKYLDANDNGDIQYSFEMDKVRFLTTPLFGLQMREGVVMRVRDHDLGVGTDNEEKYIFSNPSGEYAEVSLWVDNFVKTLRHDSYYAEPSHRTPTLVQTKEYLLIINSESQDLDDFKKDPYNVSEFITKDAQGNFVCYIFPDQLRYTDPEGTALRPGDFEFKESTLWYDKDNGFGVHIWRRRSVYGTPDNTIEYEPQVLGVDWDAKKQAYKVTCVMTRELELVVSDGGHSDTYEFRITPFLKVPYEDVSNVPLNCQSISPIDFTANKHYRVKIDVDSKNSLVGNNPFYLTAGKGNGISYYFPEYTVEDVTDEVVPAGYVRKVFAFSLPEDFNDDNLYYITLRYSTNKANYMSNRVASMRLVSVLESNTDQSGAIIDYLDLAVDTITIKFHDNTREYGKSLQGGLEPSRITQNPNTPMSREITATVKEESRASAWVTLSNRIKQDEILIENNETTFQELSNEARRHYRELLMLKNNIFDPDGTCDQTFLQVMMLQIGADSMNFQLQKTTKQLNGAMRNCDIVKTDVYDHFVIAQDDILEHFVYTMDEPGGKWYPKGNKDFILEPGVDQEGNAVEHPVYYVAIKCAVHNSQQAEWVCETTQHKVNEQDGWYYFNWGILAYNDNDMHYSLTETRGNAYMYGDNLFCGRISSMAKNSWFDLTSGNFVLGTGKGNPSLSYINGVLTIDGVNSDDPESILSRLGLLDNIGGENLAANMAHVEFIRTGEELKEDHSSSLDVWHTCGTMNGVDAAGANIPFEPGRYIASIGSLVSNRKLKGHDESDYAYAKCAIAVRRHGSIQYTYHEFVDGKCEFELFALPGDDVIFDAYLVVFTHFNRGEKIDTTEYISYEIDKVMLQKAPNRQPTSRM